MAKIKASPKKANSMLNVHSAVQRFFVLFSILCLKMADMTDVTADNYL